MSALDSYELQYEDMRQDFNWSSIPFIKTRKGGKVSKMTKSAKAATPEVAKSYNKTRGEHFKDIVIAVLITGIIAFVGGMQFAKGNQAEIERAVSAMQPMTQAVAPDAKK